MVSSGTEGFPEVRRRILGGEVKIADFILFRLRSARLVRVRMTRYRHKELEVRFYRDDRFVESRTHEQ